VLFCESGGLEDEVGGLSDEYGSESEGMVIPEAERSCGGESPFISWFDIVMDEEDEVLKSEVYLGLRLDDEVIVLGGVHWVYLDLDMAKLWHRNLEERVRPETVFFQA